MPSRTFSITTSPLPKLKQYFKQGQPQTPAIGSQTPSYIEALPSHVVHEIGVQCESLCDVLSLSLCSSRMRSLLAPYLYSNVELKTNKQCKSTLVFLSKHPEIARYVRRLVVSPNKLEWTVPGEEIHEGLVADLITRISPNLRSLETFLWEGWEMPTEDLWASLRKS
ncbi:hypothetical protein EST38_g12700 [Candolleomyces aberdarensis]|uniref:F-box domain-containing protein n=1 Tax=Candolleomyces aberdarensis TaxID=2316362 RepID=A0A4Q2D494_9AGAR|nr:hypothetical protein EST38_g12700 [Candolleomyces aberdarensis]